MHWKVFQQGLSNLRMGELSSEEACHSKTYLNTNVQITLVISLVALMAK